MLLLNVYLYVYRFFVLFQHMGPQYMYWQIDRSGFFAPSLFLRRLICRTEKIPFTSHPKPEWRVGVWNSVCFFVERAFARIFTINVCLFGIYPCFSRSCLLEENVWKMQSKLERTLTRVWTKGKVSTVWTLWKSYYNLLNSPASTNIGLNANLKLCFFEIVTLVAALVKLQALKTLILVILGEHSASISPRMLRILQLDVETVRFRYCTQC